LDGRLIGLFWLFVSFGSGMFLSDFIGVVAGACLLEKMYTYARKI
jgi:hypothetical protein